MVSPTKKRDAVAVLQGSYRISTRRACRLPFRVLSVVEVFSRSSEILV
jgi:hypothetical protein